MKKFISTTLVVLSMQSMFAQDRRHADSLLQVLARIKSGPERIDVLLKLAQFQIFKPGENQIDFDSANAYMNEADRLNLSLKSPAFTGYRMVTEAFMIREKGQQEEARRMIEKSIDILKSGDNKYYLGKAYFELSGFYTYWDSAAMVKKIELVEKSIAAFQESGNIEEKASSLRMLGDLYGINRNGAKAIECLLQALAAYKSINYQQLQGVYELLGRMYVIHNKDYIRGLQYELLALKSAQACGDSTMQLCAINNSLAGIYGQIGRRDISLGYYKNALEIALKHDDSHIIALLVYNTSYCLTLLNRPNHALELLASLPEKAVKHTGPIERAYIAMSYLRSYLGAGQNNQGTQYAVTLISLSENANIPLEVRNIMYRMLALYYLEIKNYVSTRMYLAKNAPSSASLPGSAAKLADDANLWYKLDSAQGNYQSAFYHLLTYKKINDSLFNEIKLRQLNQLEVEYETEKKQDSLKSKDRDILLLTQKNALQKENLRQSELIRNITIGGIGLAIIVMILLYRQYINKRRSSQIISGKNEQLLHLVSEKEWLLKEVHHRVKNNLQTVVSLLELQSGYLSQDALTAIQASRNRIYATSLLHQKLYQDENVSSVDMSTYIPELIHYLKDAFNIKNEINFRLTASPIELDVSQAVPVGLIINECITNAIKYAFKSSLQEPEIRVAFSKNHNDMAELFISDNGSGLPPGDHNDSTGLGLKLVKGLAEDIDGQASIESDKGTRIIIRFKIRQPLSHNSDTPSGAAHNIPV